MDFNLKISKKSIDSKRKVFIAPLDWGLGHVTRCIALAKILYEENYEVYWGLSNGLAKRVVIQYFPDAIILELNSYHVEYAKKGAFFFLKLLLQMPKIARAVRKEHLLLHQWHQKYDFDLVISDNRYGVYHPEVKTIFITHQLYPLSGKSRLLDAIAAYFHQQWLKRFTQIWKMDDPHWQLAGKLSWSKKDSYPAIGIASQLSLVDEQISSVSPLKKKKLALLFLLSGPEPQRTLLESAIFNQMHFLSSYKITLVRGTHLSLKQPTGFPFLEIIDFTSAEQLYELIQQADLVICRSGYSTLMDLVTLNKKMLLIPTPGQTEQIYLAQYFTDKRWAVSTGQQNMDILSKIEEALSLTPEFRGTGLDRSLILNQIHL